MSEFKEVPTVSGVVEREVHLTDEAAVLELPNFGDLVRLDHRTRRAVVTTGEVALLCTRVSQPEWSGSGPQGSGMQVNIGQIGVDISFARQADSRQGKLWVPASTPFARFMGPAFVRSHDRSIPFTQRVEFGNRGSSVTQAEYFAGIEAEPDDVCHIPSAESMLREAASTMPRGVSARVSYSKDSGDIVVANTSGVSVTSDLRVIGA